MLQAPPLSLYLHFPWCVRKCPYCDFNSYTLHGELAESRYVEALERDLQAQAPEVRGRRIVSIFMGGGTPSLFSAEAIGRVLEAARRHLEVSADVEITLEANPGAVERGRFHEYRAAGLNRVSLGAQSFDSRMLQALGRIHSPDETRRAAEELHAAGLVNFNLDLMYALPGQDLGAALGDVEAALALSPAHLSHYQLTIEPGTVFAGKTPELPDEDVAAEMLTACRQRLAEAGFAQYEVSAYAQAGRRCRHNLNYWAFGDYLGVGAGAHGKLTFVASGSTPGDSIASGSGTGGAAAPVSILRTVQPREPRRYLSSVFGAAVPGGITRTRVPAHELPFEFMLNALRLVEGFDRATFVDRTGLDFDTVAEPLAELVARGLMVREGTGYRASLTGRLFLNDLLLRFMPKTLATAGHSGLSTAV